MSLTDAIRDGTALVTWVPVTVARDGWRLTYLTLRDAIMVDGVRVSATARQTQLVADLLGALLPTPRLVDYRWLCGARVAPVFRVDGDIAAMSTDERYSAAVGAAISRSEPEPGLPLEAVGKHWVVTRSVGTGRYGPETARNYGWPTRASWATGRPVTPGLDVRMAQGIGGAHNLDHRDPSQTIAGLVGRYGWLRGPGIDHSADLTELAADPEFCHLVAHDGPLDRWHLPTPELEPLMDSPLRAGVVVTGR